MRQVLIEERPSRRAPLRVRKPGGCHRRRAVALLTAAQIVLIVAAGCRVPAVPGSRAVKPPQATSPPVTECVERRNAPNPWFGVLQASGRHLASESQAGLSLLSLELNWDQYEPEQGKFDGSYIEEQRQKLRAFCRAGFAVVLSTGLSHPPSWVFKLDPNTYYVNQYGDRFDPSDSGKKSANAVFNPSVRQAQATYLARVAADLGDSFYAIRVGGGPYGELHYPFADYNGHGDSYWAYDANAQKDSPVPGWKPGQGSQADARRFWDYYASKLRDYETWQVETYRRSFSGWLEMLFPGWGIRPGEVDKAVEGRLGGGTAAEKEGAMQQSTDFASQVENLSDQHVVVYSTDLGASDRGTTSSTVSPIRYLHDLASRANLPVAGENQGSGDSVEVMRLCINRVKIMGLMGMMWLDEPQLVSYRPSTASVKDYGQLISSPDRRGQG